MAAHGPSSNCAVSPSNRLTYVLQLIQAWGPILFAISNLQSSRTIIPIPYPSTCTIVKITVSPSNRHTFIIFTGAWGPHPLHSSGLCCPCLHQVAHYCASPSRSIWALCPVLYSNSHALCTSYPQGYHPFVCHPLG